MKKIIISLSILLVLFASYKLIQIKQTDTILKENGYNGSIKSGLYIKKDKSPNDVESYISLGSNFDSNDYAVSYHYFNSEEEQVSIFEKINNSKNEELAVSYKTMEIHAQL